uniref:Ig-like domain-containing protein n=1 Tax=Cyprinus carpio TaxID=7962 RepID=A0A8C2PRE7_CYPCA
YLIYALAVVRYGDNVSADCKSSVLHEGMGWEASEGAVPMTKNQNLITWRVPELTEWDIKPVCYINSKRCNNNQCEIELPVTVFKTPDSVFISTVNHRGPMMEGQQYELQCEYWCEAELDLGAEGPQPHPTNSSNPLSIAVYYKPKHSNSTETIIQDDKVMLDCTVKANPAPTYTWDHLKEKNSSSVLKSSALSPGNYTCTATNTLGRDSKVFIVKGQF